MTRSRADGRLRMGRFQQRFDVPGKPYLESIGRAGLGQLLEQVEQVCVGFQSIDLRAAHEGVQIGAGSGTLLGFSEEP